MEPSGPSTPVGDEDAHPDARWRAKGRAEAERVVAEIYQPHHLLLAPGVWTVDLDIEATQLGDLTVGRLAYGRDVTARIDEVQEVMVGFTLKGRASLSSDGAPARRVHVGAGILVPPGVPADIRLSADSEILGLMVTRSALEDELEHLLRRSLPAPLVLGPDIEITGEQARMWAPLLAMLLAELRGPSRLSTEAGARSGTCRGWSSTRCSSDSTTTTATCSTGAARRWPRRPSSVRSP